MNAENVTLGRELKGHLSKSLSCTDEETEAQRRKCLAKMTVHSTNRSGTSLLKDWSVGIRCNPGQA